MLGDLFTVEPGLYGKDLRGGVRIEDDLVVTPEGVRWMTAALPRKMSEIEAFMAHGGK